MSMFPFPVPMLQRDDLLALPNLADWFRDRVAWYPAATWFVDQRGPVLAPRAGYQVAAEPVDVLFQTPATVRDFRMVPRANTEPSLADMSTKQDLTYTLGRE